MPTLVRDLHDHFHLDHRAGWQGVHADGGAGMTAAFAEDRHEQIRATVQHLGLLREGIGALDETAHANDAADFAEVPDLRLERREQLQPAGPRGRLRLLLRQGRGDFSGDHLAIGRPRNLAGEEHEIAAADRRDVVGDHGRGSGKGQAERRQPGLGRRCGRVGARQTGDREQGKEQESRNEFHGGVPNGVAGSRPAEQRQKEIPLSRGWLRPLAVWVALVFATLPGESSASTPAAAVTEPAVASVAPAHDLILCASINRSYVIGSKMVTLSGLYRRVADGSFEHFGPNLLYLSGVSLDPRDHRTIYLAMLNGALFSRDGGERIRIGTSWDMTEPKDIAVDPNAPDTVYLALPDGFAVSTDRGWTWTRREKGLSDRGKYTQAIEIDRTRTGRLLIGCEAGVFLTENSGTRWRRVLPTRATVYDVRQSPTNPAWWIASTQRDGVHVSRDSGVTWSRIKDLAEDGAWYNVDFGTRHPDRVALSSWNQGIVVSEDGGRTWAPRNAGLPAEGRVMRVGIDPDTDALYVNVRSDDVYRSEDFGRTWSETGLKGSTVSQFLFVKKPQP